MPSFSELFSGTGLTPHGFCLLWQPGLIWLHLVSDAITGVSYYAIPVALAYFVWKRPDIDFGWMFWMFAGFILACGTTHFFDVWTLWHPDYGIQGVVKAITAAISLITAAMLWPLVPRLLQMPSRAQLRHANEQLSSQIRERNGALERLRATEERHRLLVESVAYFAIVMFDREGYMTNWSLGTQRIGGYTTQEIVGKHFSIFYPPEDRERDLPSRALEIATREGRYETETWQMRKDGSRFWATVVIHPVTNQRGQFIGFFNVTRDITARREQDDELQRIRAALAQSQKMEAVGQLTGGIAHDFNNLLTAVLGNIELIEQHGQRGDERIRRLAGAARRAAERGATLTERLLAFSRRQPLQPQATDLNQLVMGTSELLRSTLGEGIAIETLLPSDLWSAFVDPNQLDNLLINLALNARDAMPSGGRMTIETSNVYLDDEYAAAHPEVTAGPYVMLALSDTGKGMSAETAARAFEPFFTTKPIGQGTGLGLSQVYGFVRQSNGHITLDSEPGAGATMKIYFPMQLGMDITALKAPADPVLKRVHATVLVVDDDRDVREYIVSALTGLGYRVLEAGEASGALSAVECHPDVDMLLTDVGLPGINGRQLADEVSRRCAGIKILFTSGYAKHAIVHNGVLDPGVQLLSKPFTMNSLARRVAQVLQEAPST
jgi:PAS domain S-box-containing protein